MQLLNVFGPQGQVTSIVRMNQARDDFSPSNMDNLQSRLWEEVAHNQVGLDQSTFFARFKNNRLAYFSSIIFVVWTLLCVVVLLLMPEDYRELHFGLRHQAPNRYHWLGCDNGGQDYMYKLAKGYLISITAASVPTILGLTLGCIVGLFAALKGGFTDALVLRFSELLDSLDEYFVVVAVSSYFNLSLWEFNVVYCIIYWVLDAQSVRGAAMDILNKEYIENARLLGLSDFELAWRHVLPHLFSILSNLYLRKLSRFMKKEIFFICLGVRMKLEDDSIGKLVMAPYSGESLYLKAWVLWLPITIYMTVTMALSFAADGITEARNIKNFQA